MHSREEPAHNGDGAGHGVWRMDAPLLAPAALTDELAGPRPVKRVRLFGEDLVLLRDEAGRYGLLDRRCAHRGADLAFTPTEDGGLRCPFHRWLYDLTGACL